MDIINDPSQLPPNGVESLPGDAIIGIAVWAHLQGVAVSTVHRNRTLATARRAFAAGDQTQAKWGLPRPGDMPPEDGKLGAVPFWKLATFRDWQAARPGKGAGAGRPPGSGAGPAVKVRLPIECPHCHKEITKDDLPESALPGKAGASKAA